MDERAYLIDLAGKPFLQRMRGYGRLSGPGYLQSAMTLGAGTMSSCVMMGSLAGYELLWVQPLAIVLGCCVLAVVAQMVCHTGEPMYRSFWTRLHPALAVAWAVASLAATVLWHIPQYGLTANGLIVLGDGIGLSLDSTAGRAAIGAAALLTACGVVALYHLGARGLKYYEIAVKLTVWAIMIAFAIAAAASGIDWGRLIAGFTGFGFARTVIAGGEVPAPWLPVMVGGIGAAVGVNMTFLYPYSIARRGWGRDHLGLAYFDLATGMVAPFLISTCFVILAVANTTGPAAGQVGAPLGDIGAVLPVLGETLGNGVARLVIGLGMIAFGFSSIITHMLASSFIACELFNCRHDGPARWYFSLLPAAGVAGVFIKLPFFAGVTASVLAAPLLPIAVLGFLLLFNMPAYMGAAMPRGPRRWAWNAVLIASILTMSAGAYVTLKPRLAEAVQRLAAPAAQAASTILPAAHAETPPRPAWIVAAHEAMGTGFEYTIFAPAPEVTKADLDTIAVEAWADLDVLEARISDWRGDSTVGRINRLGASEAVPADADTLALLDISRRVWSATGGAFDPTVGPVVALWRDAQEAHELPPDTKVADALSKVGLDKVTAADGAVRLAAPGMRLDFGGVGKGYALDRAAALLKARGIRSAMLKASDSTILAIGAPPGEPGWTVHLGTNYNDAGLPLTSVVVCDRAVSTSANRGRYYEIADRRFGHIVDPRTGRPTEPALSASAVAANGAESDALSTAFFVMGRAGVEQYCRAHADVQAVLIAKDEGTPKAVRIGFGPEKETS